MENRFLFLSTTFYCWVNEHYLSAPSAFWIPCCCRYVRSLLSRKKAIEMQRGLYEMWLSTAFLCCGKLSSTLLISSVQWKMLHLHLKEFTPPHKCGKASEHWCICNSKEYIALSWKEIFLNAKCKTIFLFPNFGDNAISRMTKNRLKYYLLEFLSSN